MLETPYSLSKPNKNGLTYGIAPCLFAVIVSSPPSMSSLPDRPTTFIVDSLRLRSGSSSDTRNSISRHILYVASRPRCLRTPPFNKKTLTLAFVSSHFDGLSDLNRRALRFGGHIQTIARYTTDDVDRGE